MRWFFAFTLLLFATTSSAYDWDYIGMDGVNATCVTVDPEHDRVFVGTLEGFWYFDEPTGLWTERDMEGWIGRTVWAIDYHDALDQRVVTGRENAWFKGYMEYSDDLGVTEVFAYESQGGHVTDVLHDGNTYWACTWSDIIDGEFLRSSDGGVSWTAIGGHGFHAMTSLTLDLAGELVLAGDAGVKRSYDQGDSWVSLNGDLPSGYGVYCVLGAYPGGDALPYTSLFASIDLGLYYSDVPGVWTQVLNTSCRNLVRIPVNAWLAPDRIGAVSWDGRVMVSEAFHEVWTDETGDLPGTPVAAAYTPRENCLYVITAQHGLWRRTGVVAPVETPAAVPTVLEVYPNPFNPRTSLRFTLAAAGWVDLRIYDVTGREVAILVSGSRPAGEHTVDWVAKDLPSGVYVARLESSTWPSTQKLVLLK